MSALEGFGPATRSWFAGAFVEPTLAQEQAWQEIAAGRDTLVIAPTGSGKTLAAFLWAIDRLARESADTSTPDAHAQSPRCRVLYISPLKALAVDVERNLRSPLVGITREAQRLGLPVPALEVGVRTGDTPPQERRRQATHPPDILITTPESLFLLLTSQARESLAGVETVIVDEIHAVAGTKRGAHLALSLERLEEFIARTDGVRRVQRIGLSATVQPPSAVAEFLRPGGEVAIVAPAIAKDLDLRLTVPVPDMSVMGQPTGEHGGSAAGDPRRTSIWPHVEQALVDLVARERSTIVFANSRRLAERLTSNLNDLWAQEPHEDGASPVIARAHHGSVSREQRALIEDDLKAGRLPAVVATSTLELGIDMGAVDLVVQVESPPSVASGLQRVGRAGHHVGAISRGILMPKYRGDLLTCTVVLERMQERALEPIHVLANPLDVLAQQIVAMVAMDDWSVGDLAEVVRRSAPFAHLPDSALTAVLDMLAGRYPSEDFAELRPRLVWDRASGQVCARPGAQRLAVTSGGTIPDRGLFAVHLVTGGRVGELDEEMVYESRVGDVFALGASSWRIEQITHDRVIVSPAPGHIGVMPFWHGDSIGREVELGRAVGAFIRGIGGMERSQARTELTARGLDEWAIDNLIAYLDEQRLATGHLPDDRTIVVERFRDELGDWRVVIHSPLGARVHAPWAMAIAARLRADHAVETQVMHADDGIVLRLPDTIDAAAAKSVADLAFVDPEEVDTIVTAEVGGTALFASRFRECAARSLLLPRRTPGRRTPLWQQRQRSAHLLDVASRYPDFPVILETVRECLRDVFDVPALKETLEAIHNGAIRVIDVETPRPSPFAESLLFGYVASFLYEGDAPLAERRAAALALDPRLLADLLGQGELADLLDPAAIEEISRRVARLESVRDAEDLADLLRTHGPLSNVDLIERQVDPAWIAELVERRRVIEVRVAGEPAWSAIEDAGRLRDALGVALPVGIPEVFLELVPGAVRDLITRHARTHGPFTMEEVAQRFGLGTAVVIPVLEDLARSGGLVNGHLVRDAGHQWCDADVMRRIRRRSMIALRADVEPVPAETLGRFLPQWQGITVTASARTPTGPALHDLLLSTVEQLAGCPLPWSQLETLVLPARVPGYQPGQIDALMSAGEVAWWGCGSLPGGDGWIALAPIDLVDVLAPERTVESDAMSEIEHRVVAALADGGAWFFRALSDRVGAEGVVDDDTLVRTLHDLAWRGILTNDTLAPLRVGISPRAAAPRRGRPTGRPRLPSRQGPPSGAGRWSLLRPRIPAADATTRALVTAELLLARCGIVTRDSVGTGWGAAYRTLSAMEEAGRCQRVYAIEGLGAAQFAVPGAVDRLRASATGGDGALVLAAADPAQPYGSALPWPLRDDASRASRSSGAIVVIVDGRPVIHIERGGKSMIIWSDDEAVTHVAAAALVEAGRRHGLQIRLQRIDGIEVAASPRAQVLERAGLIRTPRGLRVPDARG